jgi:hypothetical protein
MQLTTGWILITALLIGGPVWAGEVQGNAPWHVQSHADVEAHARELDHRVVALQHELFAARYNNDQAAIERVEGELKRVQAERVAVLRTLGELR